jgi:hypothetical protein
VARELGGDLEADAGAPARDQRRLAPQQVRGRNGDSISRSGLRRRRGSWHYWLAFALDTQECVDSW